MTRPLLLFLLAAGSSAWALEVKTLPPAERLFHALRPGSSPALRTAKEAANTELLARGPASLRDLMTRMDTEHVMVPVLAQQLVDTLPAEQAVPVLSDFLAGPSTNQQRIALFYLGFFPAPELAPRVRPLLAVDKLRGAGLRALGKWKVTEDLPAMGAALSDTNERVRVAAANALRDVGDARAIPLLVPALGDGVFTVRNTALRALTSYGAAAEPALVAQLASPDRAARRQSIRGLGAIGSRRALKALRPLLQDADPAVRRDAERATALLNERLRKD